MAKGLSPAGSPREFQEVSHDMPAISNRRFILGILAIVLLVSAGATRALAQGKQKEQPQQTPGYSISVTVPVVNVNVVVTDNDGDFLTGLKKQNFRILDNGKPQMITNFAPTEAPITIVLMVEYSRMGYQLFTYNAVNWAAQFLNDLKPNDWVALVTFNMQHHIDVDFTHNRRAVLSGLQQLAFPPFTESNLFDALADTLDRMKDVKGKKAILVLASGIDTFSKMNLDQVLKRVRATDTTIFSVGVGEQLFLQADAMGALGGQGNLTFLQAQNQLRTFATLTGGQAWFPRFNGQIPSIMANVAASLRSQYSLAYTPSNATYDGKYHKIKVELVAPNGGPLTVTNQKGKKIKFQVYARQGYIAPSSKPGA
jgi:VWFA-related protein